LAERIERLDAREREALQAAAGAIRKMMQAA
jgi:hypothetical protein